MTSVWEEICNLVIRPQRCVYDSNVMLGPRLFMLGNKIFERKDFEIKNERKFKIKCSHYMPIDSQRKSERLPCVVYLHGNCGSRCDAIDTVQLLLPYDITVFSFDFAGSGLSEGEFVSLGYFEQHDVECVIKHLQKEGRTSKIGLWGRSMGAATALIVSQTVGEQVSGIVCDSPFSSLENVILDLVKKYGKVIPKRFTKVAIKMMKRSIMNRAGFDIYQNNPIAYARKSDTPALFGAAFDDNFIQMSQSENLFEQYGGEKTFVRFDGDHNSERPDFFYESISIFFYNVLISNDRLLKFNDPQKKRKREKEKKREKRERARERLRERARARAKKEMNETFELSDEDEDNNSSNDKGIGNAIRMVRETKKKDINRRKNNKKKQNDRKEKRNEDSSLGRRRVRKFGHGRNGSNSGNKLDSPTSSESDEENSEEEEEENESTESSSSSSSSSNEDTLKVSGKNEKDNNNIKELQSSSFREKNKQQIMIPKSLNEKKNHLDRRKIMESIKQSGILDDSDCEEEDDDDDSDDEEEENEGEEEYNNNLSTTPTTSNSNSGTNSPISGKRRREIENSLAFKNF